MNLQRLARRNRRRLKFDLRNRILYWTRLYEWIFNGHRGVRSSNLFRYNWIREQARETLHEPMWDLVQR